MKSSRAFDGERSLTIADVRVAAEIVGGLGPSIPDALPLGVGDSIALFSTAMSVLGSVFAGGGEEASNVAGGLGGKSPIGGRGAGCWSGSGASIANRSGDFGLARATR